MGWADYHLHYFKINETQFGIFDLDEEMGFLDEKAFRLEEIAHGQEIQFEYTYDFGDGWIHKIQATPTGVSDSKFEIRCIAGARSCPPEDCGGSYGYERLLKTLANSEDPEFEDMWNWAGKDFDPERFECDQVNQELKRIFRPPRTRRNSPD
ncbi:plasmid pRiA4b ORF-3 family protein [bacterium]|nr:plasmid pRiA4b ORF-3 family protein [bacterium]